MQYLEIVTENVEAFRLPFTLVEEFYLSNITESVSMNSDHELRINKVANTIHIRISPEANRQLPYNEGDLFSRLIRYKDITSLEVFSAPPNLAPDTYAMDQQDYMSYLVPWGEDDDTTNSLAEITQEDDGFLSISITV